MKKIIAALLIVALLVVGVFALVACNKDKAGYTPVNAQADIFTELNSKTADAGILDYTMASYLLSLGNDLTKDLQIVDSITLEEEEYGIAFRKGSTGLCDKVNEALHALKSTKVAEIAAKYGLTNNVLALDYTPIDGANNDDWNYIFNKKTFIVGYTLNPPMAIKADDSNELSGFDIDLPKAVVNYLNEKYSAEIEIKFQLIDWENKEVELSSKTIDCIWNGMTITEDRLANMTISVPYLLNKQSVVIRKADAEKYTTIESLKSARIVAEKGSYGEEVAQSIFA